MSTFAIRGFFRSMIVGAVSLVVGLLAMGFAPVANAAVLEVLCTGSTAYTFTPGIIDTERTVQFAATQNLTGCPVKIGVPSNLNGGTSTVQGNFLVDCDIAATLQPTNTTETYYWSNGSQSVVNYTEVVDAIAVDGTLTATFTGTVMSGVGGGSTATLVVVLPDFQDIVDGACFTPQGVTSLSGTVTLNILSL
ncbi:MULTISPECIES: hypothetical protein [Dyella]|uniref:hypothetical protein n=1 Tax=Dyella TaxID=231454 RepID=UPI000C82A05E|nr:MULTISPECIES: hypothetical protein [Dyella]MDR3444630.1 hypothetical protein [Dyella sp.]PMQ06950.1 hypothetical protein DyAD56_03470 [Dyella sp. AD56]ULU24916.1 hypothetical protein DYST_01836 [Dyella terrae]